MKTAKNSGRKAPSASFSSDQAAPCGKLLPVAAAVATALFGIADSAWAEDDKTLKAVTVTATQQQDGHRATKTRVGKVVQDPHDVPQAITTVTKALLDEQDASSLREAMRNVSGLSFNAAEGGRSGDNMNLRGFYTFGDMYLDGIRDTAQYNREVFNLEQIDVLRGAAAMLFGRGQAGGVINLVTKSPMLYGVNKVELGVGTQGYTDIKADLNQRIGETTAFRINVMQRDEESVRKNPVSGQRAEIHRNGIAPSIAFGLGTNHEVTLSHLYLNTYDNPDYGIPFDRNTKRVSTAYSRTDYWGINKTFDDSVTNISTLNYLWKISPDTQLNTKVRSANYKRAYWAAAPGDASDFRTGGSAKVRQTDTDNFVIQSDLSTRFETFGMKHELLAGVEFLKEKASRWGLANVGLNNIYYKDVVGVVYNKVDASGKTGTIIDTRPTNAYDGETYSAYIQDTIEFIPNWKLTAGIRRDEMQSSYDTIQNITQGSGQNSRVVGTRLVSYSGDFGENSYRLGLGWQPLPESHYYLSWSDSFSPTADLYQLSGSQFPAERSKVVELGAKFLLLGGDLALRTALYQADKDWERSTDLESSSSILTKRRRTTGIEFEVAGRMTDNWEVFSGISLMDPVVKEVAPGANQNFVGQTARNAPKYTFNLWTTYKLPYGFKVGGGAEYKSKRYVYDPSATGTAAFDPNVAPGYVRWDAMVAYEQPRYTVKFNIQNISDKVYYDALYDRGGFAVPGQARRFILSTEYKF